MPSLARMQTVVALVIATLMSAASASLDGLPRKLLQTTTTTPTYGGFFDPDRPSECGFTCRVIVISVGGGLVLLAIFLLICCCCCRCCRRKATKAPVDPVAAVPYNYQATPAVMSPSPAPSSTGVYAPVTMKPAGPAPAYPALTANQGGRVGPPAHGSSYTAPADGFARTASGSSNSSGIGRNTMPGTYNPRKF